MSRGFLNIFHPTRQACRQDPPTHPTQAKKTRGENTRRHRGAGTWRVVGPDATREPSMTLYTVSKFQNDGIKENRYIFAFRPFRSTSARGYSAYDIDQLISTRSIPTHHISRAQTQTRRASIPARTSRTLESESTRRDDRSRTIVHTSLLHTPPVPVHHLYRCRCGTGAGTGAHHAAVARHLTHPAHDP
jgi:hypothetical protein